MADHRELARDMDLFHFEEHSPGMVFWHPQGLRLLRSIENFMQQIYQAHEFEEVRSPIVLKRSLWERSGHWEKFGKGMFVVGSKKADEDNAAQSIIDADYALKPMSCPAHIAIYQSHKRSYRENPMRLMEFGICHRNESGTLSGCMRLRQFVQDDAHIFCRESDVQHEIGNFLKMVQQVYVAFGYNQFSLQISLRPQHRLGSDRLWDRAESLLIETVQSLGYSYQLAPNEGAFYGPKLEISLQDHLGRSWQCGTFQVDFNLPQIFELAFVNERGELERPIMLHQAILGSLERWIGILLEHHRGILPVWAAPTQVAIASISNKASVWAETIFSRLKQLGVRVELDNQDQTISKKIRELSKRRIPVIAIVGEQEAKSKTLNLRCLGAVEQQEISLAQLEHKLVELVMP
ncbi:threonine--tRNA ligase [Gloeocapsopsis crepidinum LEGE 06123]|uniref:Threonine--tRNA ligase n=1 Tax=Gloeocapsopsis crepidinum LEGE 06123 TaxID=588587 RepID=A0ABR9UKQ8_9CHRO|nr:threonine--tRNA ligase [Gloeocapsopsis crepidinum]MBE9188879.1 threonine--tRNA ligase [Gloeocapsopsis crepidinum LEGE 06123]